ncbi:MAG: twin-arginine translocase TatA/TatE family subunit [Bdellovibrionaceae bacterium]|nr:twin-arginine translocase TatA/TatE family subunit [Pseudobdellovibrionaceae bacterium]
MSLSHLIILGLIMLIVIPPEKLPEIMRNLGRFINDLKRQTSGIFTDVTGEFKDIKKDLTPDINLTPSDMLKKLNDKNETVNNVTVTSNDATKTDAAAKTDHKS